MRKQWFEYGPWKAKMLAVDAQLDRRYDPVDSVIFQLNLIRGSCYTERSFVFVFPNPFVPKTHERNHHFSQSLIRNTHDCHWGYSGVLHQGTLYLYSQRQNCKETEVENRRYSWGSIIHQNQNEWSEVLKESTCGSWTMPHFDSVAKLRWQVMYETRFQIGNSNNDNLFATPYMWQARTSKWKNRNANQAFLSRTKPCNISNINVQKRFFQRQNSFKWL